MLLYLLTIQSNLQNENQRHTAQIRNHAKTQRPLYQNKNKLPNLSGVRG